MSFGSSSQTPPNTGTFTPKTWFIGPKKGGGGGGGAPLLGNNVTKVLKLIADEIYFFGVDQFENGYQKFIDKLIVGLNTMKEDQKLIGFAIINALGDEEIDFEEISPNMSIKNVKELLLSKIKVQRVFNGKELFAKDLDFRNVSIWKEPIEKSSSPVGSGVPVRPKRVTRSPYRRPEDKSRIGFDNFKTLEMEGINDDDILLCLIHVDG